MNRYREIKYADGMPCSHPACHAHKSHPCEVCGRIQCIGDVYENPFMRGLNKKEYPERVFIKKDSYGYPFIYANGDGVEYIRADKGEEVGNPYPEAPPPKEDCWLWVKWKNGDVSVERWFGGGFLYGKRDGSDGAINYITAWEFIPKPKL